MTDNESPDPISDRYKRARAKLEWWHQERPVPPLVAQQVLREWWHDILRNYGRYNCYAIFLGLPADKELINYLTHNDRELELISGDDCLVLMLTSIGFRRFGIDDVTRYLIADEHIRKGRSAPIAKVFGIKFDQFPCLIIFNDIRSSKHISITLKDLEADEIATVTRSVFSSIDQALGQKKNPIEVLEISKNKQEFLKKGERIMSDIRTFADKTLDTVVESWIKSVIK